MSADNSSHKKKLSSQNVDAQDANSQNADAAELIVELYSEEIPWRMQEPMAQNLAKLLQAELISALGLSKGVAQKNEVANESGGVFGKLHLYWTPRRVAVAFAAVPKKSKAWVEQRKGPRVASPRTAIEGFVRNNNLVSEDECIKVKDAKGDYYALEVEHLAVATSKVLGEVVATVIYKMQKELKVSMRFANQSFKWVRPLHHILVVFDSTGVQGSIDLGTELGNELDATEKLDFTAKTRGHPHAFAKPLTSAEPLAVASIADYESKLRANHVEPLYAERLAMIKKDIESAGYTQNIVIEENACLTEYPAVLTGHFDKEFLSLPAGLTQAVLNQHQKIIYRVLGLNQKNDFYFVANVSPATDKKKVNMGVERVVRARLADAKFMLERDMKIPIAEHIKKLEHITFHPKLGSIADKNARVKKLIPVFINELKKHKDNPDAKEYYDLVMFEKRIDERKMGLATETVREFPKLQAMIAEQLNSGEIFENIMHSHCVRIIKLADAIDSLVSLWLAGERATGSGDPFFLRRYALDIIKNIIDNERPENSYYLPLSVIFTEAIKIIHSQNICKNKDLEKQDTAVNLAHFIIARMRQWLSDFQKDVREDCIEAILDERAMSEDCNILEIFNRIKTLHEEIEKSNHLVEIFRRLDAIVPAPGDGYFVHNIPDEKLFEKAEEKALYALAKDIILEGKAWDELSYKQKLESLADLKGVVDAFLDKVMVNVDDQAIRENRVKLLCGIHERFEQLANFYKIQHKDLQQQSRIKQAN